VQECADTYFSAYSRQTGVTAMAAYGATASEMGRGNDSHSGGGDTPGGGHPQPPEMFRGTKMCFNFNKTGGCKYGDKCRFKHEGKQSGAVVGLDESARLVRVQESRVKLGAFSICSAKLGSLKKVAQSRVLDTRNSYSVLDTLRGASLPTGTAQVARNPKTPKIKKEPPPPPSRTPPAPAKQSSPGERARFDSYFLEMAAGMGISKRAAKRLLCGGLQGTSEAGFTTTVFTKGIDGVIVDTGATVRVIGKPHMHLVRNRVALSNPVYVQTASGEEIVTEMGDLPGFAGLMLGCLLIPKSTASLLPVQVVCKEFDYGFEVPQGGGASHFHQDRVSVLNLDVDGSLNILAADSVIRDRSVQESVHWLREEKSKIHLALVSAGCELPSDRFDNSNQYSAERAVSDGSESCQCDTDSGSSYPCKDCKIMYSSYGCIMSSKGMRAHRLGGHSDFNENCPDCARGKFKARQHFRKSKGSKANPAGRAISLDFSGPHDQGVAGGCWALVACEMQDDWGFVSTQEGKSASETLKSIKELNRQLKIDSGRPTEGIVSIHHDDDKSFRGEVEAYAIEQGWADTHTGGYNPNANSKVERRIGMLQQQFRVILLACTGGHLYYNQLWDVGLKYSNYILNTNKWADCDSPISRLSGTVHYRSKNLHVFGAYCLFHVPKELRDGKFRPPSEMGIWVGLDSAVQNGHLVVPIEWQHSTQSWLLGGVITATTVKVYEDVFPLRKAPPPGTVGTVAFDTFVDKVVEPLYSNRPNELEVAQPMAEPEGAQPQPGASRKRQAPQYRNPNRVRAPKSVSGPVNYEIAKIVDSRIVKTVK
jgi:hypothetical protein